MPGIAPTLAARSHDSAVLTADIAPFFYNESIAEALVRLPAPTLARLKQAVWTVLSLDTGTAGQHQVRPGRGTGPGAAGGTGGTASGTGGTASGTVEPRGTDHEDQVDGDEVADLVARAQDGDPSAFGEIYDRYSDTVYRYIYFRVNNAQLAEDLASETFLRALRRISSFSWQGRAFGAWLVTIARNLVVDHFKSGRYRLEIVKPDVLGADERETDPSTSPETAALEKLTNATLLTAVKKLNPDQQECIVLRFLQGFTVAETARTMGKNEGAVKALQYRAVRTLARLLPDGFRG